MFHRVILHSGSALNPWAVVSKPQTYFRQLAVEMAAMFNCTQPVTSSQQQQQQQQLFECLEQVPVDQLISIELPSLRYRSTVGPVVNEDRLVTTDARQLMMSLDSRAPWSQLNVLLGFVSNEGIHSDICCVSINPELLKWPMYCPWRRSSVNFWDRTFCPKIYV